MPKSRAAKNAGPYNARIKSAAITLPTEQIILYRANSGPTKVDLSRLRHQKGDQNRPKVPDRQDAIDRFVCKLHQSLREGGSQESWYNKFIQFLRYLSRCDAEDLSAVSEEGYRGYYHFLWQRVRDYDPFRSLWRYQNGEVFGLAESAAGKNLSEIRFNLSQCGIFDPAWDAQLPPFSSRTEHYPAYSQNELETALERLLSYFGQLAAAMIKTGSPTDPVSVEINGEIITVSGKGGNTCEKWLDYYSPFNQAMHAAYCLTAYFTAFNTGPLLGVCRPLLRISSPKSVRTEEWFELRAYKRRANKDVRAVVGGAVTAEDEISLKFGRSGWGFLTLLETLSENFHPVSNGSLLYLLGKDNLPRSFNLIARLFIKLSQTLHLKVDATERVVELLHRTFFQLLENHSYDRVWRDYEKGMVRRETIPIKVWAPRAWLIAFVLLDIFVKGADRLKHITLPLSLAEKDSVLTVSFRYDDGTPGTFQMDACHLPFLEKLIAFSESNNWSSRSVKPRYLLLCRGSKNNGYFPWRGLTPSGSASVSQLSDYGVESGDYLLNLNSSQFRQTNAKIARAKSQGTQLRINQILQNSLAVQLAHYSDDNPDDNRRIMHQALLVVELMARGESLEKAKKAVAESLNIEVLTLDQLTARTGRSNVAGTFCSGGLTPSHRNQVDRVEKLQLLEKDFQLKCSQYDQCIDCPHAKLVDEVEAVWRLLSFAECIDEAADLFPSQHEVNLGETVRKIQLVLKHNLPKRTLDAAQQKLANEGRHPYWQTVGNLTIPRRSV